MERVSRLQIFYGEFLVGLQTRVGIISWCVTEPSHVGKLFLRRLSRSDLYLPTERKLTNFSLSCESA